jgi:gamma-glutamyltranspeptidase/glutathione hydrolase
MAKSPYADSEGVVQLEQGRAVAQLANTLRALGHEVQVVPLQSGMAFIVREQGYWNGAADPRRDGIFASSR